MEAFYRSSPLFADIDWSNPPEPPAVIPPRPPAPMPRILNPPRRENATSDLLASVKEAHSPSAKKESD